MQHASRGIPSKNAMASCLLTSGPPEKKPILPRYDNLETLDADVVLWSDVGGFGATGDASLAVLPYSWLHMNDNIMDPFHVHVCIRPSAASSFTPSLH